MVNDKYIDTEKNNPLVYFTGTEAEQAREDEIEARNAQKLRWLYDSLILFKNIDYFYITSKPENGRQIIYIVHNSAKYSNPQLTAVCIQNGLFAYMIYDCEIDSFNKLKREFKYWNTRIYYAALDTV